jgi:molybdate-binding protein
LRNQHKIEFEEKIHGYKEKENLDDLVKECVRKNYADLNLPTRKKAAAKKVKVESLDSFPVSHTQYDSSLYSHQDWNKH